MLHLALTALLLIAAPAGAQDGDAPPVRWPVLAQAAPDAAGFVPRGWALAARRAGDVDGDRVPDLVMILQQRSAANVLDGGGGGKLDTNPRLLVVAKGGRGGYRLLLANRTLIPRHLYGNLEDPLGELDRFAVRRGAFVVPLHLFANSGGWTMFNRDFTFRVVSGRAMLVGFDEVRVQRNTGEIVTTSVNYLTGVRSVAIGSVSDDGVDRPRRTRLPKRALLTIEQVGNGMAFEAG